jgi:hypothetical protein
MAASAVGHEQGRHAARAVVGGRAAEGGGGDGHAGELAHHRRTAHERVGLLGHHHLVAQAEQQGRARHGGSGGGGQDGHDARGGDQLPGRSAPAVQRGDPSWTSAPLEAMTRTSGTLARERRGRRARCSGRRRGAARRAGPTRRTRRARPGARPARRPGPRWCPACGLAGGGCSRWGATRAPGFVTDLAAAGERRWPKTGTGPVGGRPVLFGRRVAGGTETVVAGSRGPGGRARPRPM